jgi:hypothetical protein
MLGIDDWSRRTSTMHADIELIVFFVVTAHLGEASNEVLFRARLLTFQGVGSGNQGCAHTAVGRDGTPQSIDGWTDPALISIADKATESSMLREDTKARDISS